MRYRLTDEQNLDIAKAFSNGDSIDVLATKYNKHKASIRRILFKFDIFSKNTKSKTKGGFSYKDKLKIINLYTIEKRGKSYIGKLFNVSDFNINYWLKKWGVKSISRSDISTKIREIYGPTKGFGGRKHKVDSKIKISNSLYASWEDDREPMIGKSRTYDTIIGKVLGTWEVAYLQKLKTNNEQLPTLCHKRYKTPYGSYKPDFEFNDRFIEIKSEFTLKVAKGKYKSHGKYSNNQFKKIKYVNDNIKKIEIIVLDKDEAISYFKMAKKGILK
jgi:hypothetical protein